MSCKIPYIEQQFRDVNPSLADTLNTKYSQIWDSVIESELFKKEDDTSKYLMATTNISRLQEQQDFIDKVNQDNSVPEGASVIENLNGYVNVNVLNLPEVTGVSTSTIKEGVEELFNENPELSTIGTPQQYSQYLDGIFPDSKVKDIVYHGSIYDNKKFKDSTRVTGHYFSTTPKEALQHAQRQLPNPDDAVLYNILLNIKNPKVITKPIDYEDLDTEAKIYKDDTVFGTDYDSLIAEKVEEYNTTYKTPESTWLEKQIVVFEPEQIHILGNKQDIEGFKEFVNKQPKPKVNDVTVLEDVLSVESPDTVGKINNLINRGILDINCS
jgi:hypothetical protein